MEEEAKQVRVFPNSHAREMVDNSQLRSEGWAIAEIPMSIHTLMKYCHCEIRCLHRSIVISNADRELSAFSPLPIDNRDRSYLNG